MLGTLDDIQAPRWRPKRRLSIDQLREQFPDEDACRRLLEEAIWPEGRFCLTLTFDIMFEDGETYQRVIRSGVLTKASFATLYDVPEKDVLLFEHEGAKAIKISIPRAVHPVRRGRRGRLWRPAACAAR